MGTLDSDSSSDDILTCLINANEAKRQRSQYNWTKRRDLRRTPPSSDDDPFGISPCLGASTSTTHQAVPNASAARPPSISSEMVSVVVEANPDQQPQYGSTLAVSSDASFGAVVSTVSPRQVASAVAPSPRLPEGANVDDDASSDSDGSNDAFGDVVTWHSERCANIKEITFMTPHMRSLSVAVHEKTLVSLLNDQFSRTDGIRPTRFYVGATVLPCRRWLGGSNMIGHKHKYTLGMHILCIERAGWRAKRLEAALIDNALHWAQRPAMTYKCDNIARDARGQSSRAPNFMYCVFG